jgi:hypothetical protein
VALSVCVASLWLGAVLAAGQQVEVDVRLVPSTSGQQILESDRGSFQHPVGPWEFYFTRAIYSGGRGRRWGPRWSTDYPKADLQFISILQRVTNLGVYEGQNAIRLNDPNLRRFPFLYALEVGSMTMTDEEVAGLRAYLIAGGFLLIDDFWGTWEWQNFEMEIRRVLPEYSIVDVPLEHPIFNMVYDIDEVVQVPAVNNAIYGGPTWERDGYVPETRAIFDEDGRMMVMINWNTDLGDAWEWADNPYYPLQFSTYAFQMGVNFVVYAMTH